MLPCYALHLHLIPPLTSCISFSPDLHHLRGCSSKIYTQLWFPRFVGIVKVSLDSIRHPCIYRYAALRLIASSISCSFFDAFRRLAPVNYIHQHIYLPHILTVPLCFLKTLEKLGFTSVLSLVPLVYLLIFQVHIHICSTVINILPPFYTTLQPDHTSVYRHISCINPRIQIAHLATNSLFSSGSYSPGIGGSDGIFVCLPIVVFAYSSQQGLMLLALYASLTPRTTHRTPLHPPSHWQLTESCACSSLSHILRFARRG
jgi:hypothetical protein